MECASTPARTQTETMKLCRSLCTHTLMPDAGPRQFMEKSATKHTHLAVNSCEFGHSHCAHCRERQEHSDASRRRSWWLPLVRATGWDDRSHCSVPLLFFTARPNMSRQTWGVPAGPTLQAQRHRAQPHAVSSEVLKCRATQYDIVSLLNTKTKHTRRQTLVQRAHKKFSPRGLCFSPYITMDLAECGDPEKLCPRQRQSRENLRTTTNPWWAVSVTKPQSTCHRSLKIH